MVACALQKLRRRLSDLTMDGRNGGNEKNWLCSALTSSLFYLFIYFFFSENIKCDCDVVVGCLKRFPLPRFIKHEPWNSWFTSHSHENGKRRVLTVDESSLWISRFLALLNWFFSKFLLTFAFPLLNCKHIKRGRS